MKKLSKMIATGVVLNLILATQLSGCFGYSLSVAPDNKEKEFKEPYKTISQNIENEVSKNGSIKLHIQSMCINNPENLNHAKTYYDPSISLIILENDKTEALNVNLGSPIDTGDEGQQEDILVYLTDIASLHYTDEGDDYIEIKDSPNKYYISNKVRYHSYTAEIYINKNNNTLRFGENTHKEGKSSTVQTSTQQIK